MPKAKETIYGEGKRRFTMTLTETAIEWLEEQRRVLGANSLSDAVERMARAKPENNAIAQKTPGGSYILK
jgi:uncharacterized protein YjiS (DUF1127 family)